MTKLIIDTDPGIDDSMAIQFAFASKAFDILGLTTVFGNVSVDLTTTNALRLLHLLERPEVAVAKGASIPLYGEFSGGVPFIHGDDGQGNTWKPEAPNSAISDAADDFIIKKINECPGQVSIAALGPLTNLATALQKDPEIQNKVKEVVFMGGNAFCGGNATPAAEANVLSDPEAADSVLGANWPITMVGLDVTHRTLLTRELYEEISTFKSPINDHVSQAYQFYLDFFRKANKIEGTYLHDASVFAYLLNRDLYETISCPVRVDTMEGLSRGKTWPATGDADQEGRAALLPWQNRPNVNICVDVKAAEVLQLLKEGLMK